MYHGDIRLGDTIDVKFTTRSFTTGAPTTLAGTPAISAYVGNGTTEITAGITLTVDFDARTGLNNVRVVATSGNGYATATNVDLVITAGTVGGVSVVGEVIGSFSIEARSAVMPTVAARTLDVSSTGEAGVDWANVGSPTTTVNLSGTTTNVVNTATAVTTVNGLAANTITATSIAADAITAAKIADGAIDAATFAAGAINAAAIAADAITDAKVASDVTIASVTGAVGSVTGNVGGNVTGSVGSVVGAVGSVTGNVGGNVVGSVGSVTGLTTATIADKVLGRNVAGGSDGTRTVSEALYVLRNKTNIGAGTLTVYQTDDTTPAFTATVTTAAGNPISSIDPA